MGSGEDLRAPAGLPYEVADVLARLVVDGARDVHSVAETWSDLAALNIDGRVDLDGPRAYNAADVGLPVMLVT